MAEPKGLLSLQARAGWLTWAFKAGKKPPCDGTGFPLKAWRGRDQSYTDAKAVLERLPFGADDPQGVHPRAGLGIENATGIDLDDCIQADGSLDPRAEAVLNACPGYIEYSPSGKGLKAFFKVDPPQWLELNFSSPDKVLASVKEPIYFVVTGRVFRDGDPDADGTAALQQCHDLFQETPGGPLSKPRTAALPKDGQPIPPGQQDDWLRNRAFMAAAKGLQFEDVMLQLRLDIKRCPPSGAPWGEDDLIRHAQSAVAKNADKPEDFHRNKDGRPIHSEANLALALRLEGVSLRHNLFQARSELTRNGIRVPYNDLELNTLMIDLENHHHFGIGVERFYLLCGVLAGRNRYHPVRDYFTSLRWDGKQRVDGWLTTYGHAAPSDYVRAVGRLFLIAAVRRIREPGCKYDEMLSLISGQGQFKSTALKTLCPDPEWFHDSFSLHVDAKQIIEQSRGKMIVEVADLKGYGTKDTEHIKAILSSSTDTARLAYGRETQEVMRQFVFAATTNVDAFLRDPTGSRRFWPVPVGVFNIPGLAEDRDQLWAEACQMESEGGSIRLAPELWAAAGEVQSARTVDEPMFDALEALLGPEEPGKVTTNMIWEQLDAPLHQRNNWALSAAMQKLGFTKRKLHTGNSQEKLNGWVRPEDSIPKGLKWFFKDPSGGHAHEGDQF